MIRLAKYNVIGVVGRVPQRPNCGPGEIPEVRGRSVRKFSAQALGERCVPQSMMMASFEAWERSRSGREGVWPYLDAMDTVCLRTVSMEWNMPEKYGPHVVLLFFLL